MTTRKQKNHGLSSLGRRTADPAISWLMKLALDHPHLISLAAGFTDNEALPVKESKELLEEILGSKKSGCAALQYGSTQGDPELLRLTTKRLRRHDQLPPADSYSAGRLMVTHGSQQLLYILTECLCDPSDLILVEDPTYFVFLGIAESHGVQCRGVPMQPDGLDVKALESILEQLKAKGELPRLKLLYLVTYFQNPTGITTCLRKKTAALQLLNHYERWAGHPIYLLEDAAYREMRFAGEDAASALSVKRFRDRVIYAGTYSKPFATGVRIGFGYLPPGLFDVVYRVKSNHDFGTSNLLQQLLARALASCKYESHLQTARARYRHKAERMSNALERHFPPAVQWQPPRGGIYFWARLPRSIKTGIKSSVFRQSLERDVLYVPGELCYADDPARSIPNHEMRLSFGNAKEMEIDRAIKRLGKVLRRALG